MKFCKHCKENNLDKLYKTKNQFGIYISNICIKCKEIKFQIARRNSLVKRKGKTLKEIHGAKKAEIIKNKQKETIRNHPNWYKHNGYKHSKDTIEKLRIFGKTNFNSHFKSGNKNISKKFIGKTYEEINGIEKALQRKIKLSISKKKSIKEIGKFNKGKNEDKIINMLQMQTNEKIIQSYLIKDLGYEVDGYCEFSNIVFEVDEIFHDRQKEKDLIRQRKIGNYLECKFIRIKLDKFGEVNNIEYNNYNPNID